MLLVAALAASPARAQGADEIFQEFGPRPSIEEEIALLERLVDRLSVRPSAASGPWETIAELDALGERVLEVYQRRFLECARRRLDELERLGWVSPERVRGGEAALLALRAPVQDFGVVLDAAYQPLGELLESRAELRLQESAEREWELQRARAAEHPGARERWEARKAELREAMDPTRRRIEDRVEAERLEHWSRRADRSADEAERRQHLLAAELVVFADEWTQRVHRAEWVACLTPIAEGSGGGDSVDVLRRNETLRGLASSEELSILLQINRWRLLARRRPLGLDVVGGDRARHFAERLERFDFFEHGPSYERPMIAENVARGLSSPGQVLEAWLASPIHCTNVLDESFRLAGVGRSGGTWCVRFR